MSSAFFLVSAMTYPRNLVTSAWLAAHLDDPRVVVADCRFSLADPQLGRRQYDDAHIPGAVYLDLNQDLSSPVQSHGGRHPLPDWDAFVATLERVGVFSDGPDCPTLVVVYDASRFAFAARLWWMLKYLGHDQVAVLDGGWSAWQQQGLPTSIASPTPRQGQFTPHPQADWIVDIDYVRRHNDADSVLLVDSRSPERYRGEVEPIDPVAGTIPGSINYFWQDVSDGAGLMRSEAQLVQHWAGLPPDGDIITYCGSGVTACVNLLSRAIINQPMGKLYVGGWSDWCSYF
jgi:thiosulfate/3-mercaptopyruvate sulfurtransferase